MLRRFLPVAALLILFAACRDGPAALTAPMDTEMAPQPDVTASADAVWTVVDMLDDPFVRELVGEVGIRTERLYRAVRDVSAYGTDEHVVKLSRVLTETASGLLSIESDAQEDADAVILRAALELVLAGAVTLLDEPLRAGRGKQAQDFVQR